MFLNIYQTFMRMKDRDVFKYYHICREWRGEMYLNIYHTGMRMKERDVFKYLSNVFTSNTMSTFFGQVHLKSKQT